MKDQIIVRQYGLLAPLNWDQDCQEQLWLQNKFWNRLVEIEAQYQEKSRALTSADDAVSKKEAELDGLLDRRAEALKERNRLRSEHRSKKIDTSLLDRQAKECAEQIKLLKPELKLLRAQARERNKVALVALNDERKEMVKQARNASGLWWGNYNAVAAAYDVARVKGLKEGRALKFHRFDGTGRFTCQIQGGMPLNKLFDGKGTVAVAPLPAEAFSHPSRGEQRRLQRTQLTFTIYTFVDDQEKKQRRTLTFPMTMHRPIPDDAIIKSVALKRDRVGTEFRWTVTFTCVRPGEPVEHPGQTICGIDLGWRTLEGEGVRVATLADNAGGFRQLILPSNLIDAFEWVDNIKSRLDQGVNEIHLWLKTRTAPEIPEPLQEDWGIIKKAPKISAARIAALTLRWRENHQDHCPDLLAHLEQWRKRDKRFRQEMDNLRQKTVARREDIYRNEALRIAQQYALIGLEDFDLRSVARLENAEGQDNALHQAARRMRQRVAVSEFRKWLQLQAEKTGSEIFKVSGKTSLVHHRCGQEIKPEHKHELEWHCSHCKEFFDQDENAAMNIMLAAAGEPASDQVRAKAP